MVDKGQTVFEGKDMALKVTENMLDPYYKAITIWENHQISFDEEVNDFLTVEIRNWDMQVKTYQYTINSPPDSEGYMKYSVHIVYRPIVKKQMKEVEENLK